MRVQYLLTELSRFLLVQDISQLLQLLLHAAATPDQATAAVTAAAIPARFCSPPGICVFFDTCHGIQGRANTGHGTQQCTGGSPWW